MRAALLLALYAGGWVAMFVVGDSWYNMIVALFLAVVFGQAAFLGHDIGHRQAFPSRRLNRFAGLVVGNLATGVSYGYWVTKHNQHHAHPNQAGADPDVGPGVISWTPEQAAAKSGLGRLIARHQASLFFPLTCLEALNLHVSSVRTLRSRVKISPTIEALLLAAHFVAFLVIVFLVLSPLRAAAFVGVQQAAFGLYLGCAFAPNHKGMPMPEAGQQMDFVQRQVTTARNVRGGRALTVALGGLNYQIEHHLFPTMPMSNLRRCQPMVRSYCASHEIDYVETSLFGSYRLALRHLRSVSQRVRRPNTPPPGAGHIPTR